jgi:sec-independent protein translocase protein TatB
MFDFGWQEFIMVAFVLVLVVGPKDLPKVLRGFTKITSQARQMAREFTRSLEDVAGDESLKDVKTMVADLKTGNLDDMARMIDDQDMSSEIKKIKENVDVSSIASEVKSVQNAGKDESSQHANPSDKKTQEQG